MSEACDRWIALSDREALGEHLSADERAFSSAHLASCDECRAEAGLWQELGELVDGAPPRETPVHITAKPPGRMRHRRIAVGAFAAGAAAVLVAIAWGRITQREDVPVTSTPSPTPSSLTLTSPTVPTLPAATPTTVTLAVASGSAIEIDGRPAVVGQALNAGSVVSARDGIACVVATPAVRACVAPGSLFRVVDLGADRRFELISGRIVVELERQPAGTTFGVLTREGAAIAVGTSFSVELPSDEGVALRVLHGTILVQPSLGASWPLREHETSSFRGAPPSPLATSDERRDRALLESASPAPTSGGSPVRIDADSPGATVTVDGAVVGATPIALLLARGRHEISVAPVSHPVVREQIDVGADPVVRRFDTAALTRTPSPVELLQRARERRAAADIDGSIAAYRDLLARHPSSAEAHAALVPLGELQLASRSDPGAALASFDRYLVRGGPLEEEASFGRIRALRALGRSGEELVVIGAFLRRFPDSPLAPALRDRHRALGGD